MDSLDFMDTAHEWRCAMCGVDLKQAVAEQFNPLDYTPDQLIDGEFDRRKRQYVWERTQERPRLTCCRSCGYNYKAWKSNLDSKKSYVKGKHRCYRCEEIKVGGRILKSRYGKDMTICRTCHRKQMIYDMRKQWEEQHREERNAYTRQWRAKQKASTMG
jgi:hypothetical protein